MMQLVSTVLEHNRHAAGRKRRHGSQISSRYEPPKPLRRTSLTNYAHCCNSGTDVMRITTTLYLVLTESN